jgi:molecular chaperone GrpE
MSDPDTKADAAEFEDTEPQAPAIDPEEFEALKLRAEGAERKLREIQGTFVAAKAELEATRARLERDLERKVEIRFAELVRDLLECADDLDRAIEHGSTIAAAAPVLRGVALARERFVAALSRAGLERIDPVGESYDPNVAEAVGMVPVSDPQEHDTVMQIERAGYRLGSRVVRPARVLVGQLVS